MSENAVSENAVSENPVQQTVTVCGEAAVRTEPDEAIVWITLSALKPDPGSALADVARRTESLARLLDELEIARADRSTTGVSVAEDFDHTKAGRRSLGHRAQASVSVRLVDNELIGRLITRASTELDPRINGPRWRISPGNPVWLEAATQAAANAQAKAGAYAAGVQAGLGRLLTLAEPEHGHAVVRARAMSAAPDMDIQSGEQEVVATINATFELEPR